ncbi:MarR family winged helix-turn-helix transcriptional regulator [Nocardia wallacei]|uniref:MarR family winged helix-turn-helix transcriptional regulator n=1 Tax=Nocardia wallacei TaxID=480035 RepID=UPI002453BCFA|nr:MarR family transcriptional regulator [Nocardia wallacei]
MADQMAAKRSPARLRALPTRLVNLAAIASNRLTDQALAGTGARRYHFAMLAALEEFGPATQADLGRCTGIDRSDVVAVVNSLAEAGCVDRRPDPDDGRRNIVSITPAGIDYLAKLDALLAEAQAQLLRALSATERDELVRLLTAIIDDFGMA